MIAGFRMGGTSRTRISRTSFRGTRSTSAPPELTAPTCRAKERSLKHQQRELSTAAIQRISQAIGHGYGELIFDIPEALPEAIHLLQSLPPGTGITISFTSSTPS